MAQDALDKLIAHGDDEGVACSPHLQEVVQELELDDEQVEALYKQIDEAGLELTTTAAARRARDDVRQRRPRPRDDDALQLFLNEAGRYKLLTAEEEVDLSKRIERGDKTAKDL